MARNFWYGSADIVGFCGAGEYILIWRDWSSGCKKDIQKYEKETGSSVGTLVCKPEDGVAAKW